MGFIFGENTPWTYDDIQQKRRIAESLTNQIGSPRNVGEGLSAIGKALGARGIDRRAGKRESELDAEWENTVAGMGLDPKRAAIYSALKPGQREMALLSYFDRQDAERRAAASRGASAAKAAAEDQKALEARMAIAQALQPRTEPTGAPMGPTMDAANAGATSGADLAALQTRQVQPDQSSIVNALIGNPNIPLGTIDDVMGLLPEQSAQYDVKSGADLGFQGEDASRFFNVSPDGRVTAIGGGGVTVNTGSQGPQMGTIPQGYTAIEDPSNPSGFRMVAIPGGPEDTTKMDNVAQQNRERSGSVVTEDIGRALEIIEGSPRWTTGLGAALRNVPGTQAKSLSGLLQTIGANVGFDRLQQMRDASPTGGALGAINQTEMQLLQSALGNLEQSLSAEDLARNLNRLNDIYVEIIHGPGGAPAQPQETTGLPSDPASFEEFAKSPGVQAAAQKYGVSVEDMWAIKQGQK